MSQTAAAATQPRQHHHAVRFYESERALAQIDGSPDEQKFHEAMHAVIRRACGRRTDCTVRIYGHMVDVLWHCGERDAAIRLEVLWNRLAATQAFSLLWATRWATSTRTPT